MKHKRLLLFLFSWFIFTAIITPSSKAVTPYIPPEKSREELYQDIFISMLMPKITEQINHYYDKVLTKSPMLYPYMVFIEEAERVGDYRTFEFLLTVKTYPVVGPHIEVGQDRIKIAISGTGKTEIKAFEHMKDYDLPDNWQHIKKQTFPNKIEKPSHQNSGNKSTP